VKIIAKEGALEEEAEKLRRSFSKSASWSEHGVNLILLTVLRS
jgi:hypothetical protein